MTDRHAGYIVILDHDTREDAAEHIINALRMVRGVVDVQPVTANLDERIAEVRVGARLRTLLYETLEGSE